MIDAEGVCCFSGISAEHFHVQSAFYQSLAHMPAYNGLKFEITAIERVDNITLADQFHASHRYFYEQHSHSSESVRTVYHGTLSASIPSIVQENLSMAKKGSTDAGWFGGGLYFSKYADYCMMYASANKKPLTAGKSCKLIQFDIVPGRIHQMDEVKVGALRTPGYDSHVSPNGFEYVMFESNHILPRYVISINVVKAARVKFPGSIEEEGGMAD
jgi:hypothetical protein